MIGDLKGMSDPGPKAVVVFEEVINLTEESYIKAVKIRDWLVGQRLTSAKDTEEENSFVSSLVVHRRKLEDLSSVLDEIVEGIF